MAYIPTECTQQEFEDILYTQDSKNKIYISFNGAELTNADKYCEKLNVSNKIIKNGNKYFSLDNFVSKELTLIIHDISIVMIKSPIVIKLGTYINDDVGYVYVPLGVFNVQNVSTTGNRKLTIKLRDNSIKLDFDYSPKNLIENSNNVGIYYEDIINDICDKAGIQWEGFLHKDKLITTYKEGLTARQYISYIAEKLGLIATIDREGKLRFINYGKEYISPVVGDDIQGKTIKFDFLKDENAREKLSKEIEKFYENNISTYGHNAPNIDLITFENGKLILCDTSPKNVPRPTIFGYWNVAFVDNNGELYNNDSWVFNISSTYYNLDFYNYELEVPQGIGKIISTAKYEDNYWLLPERDTNDYVIKYIYDNIKYKIDEINLRPHTFEIPKRLVQNWDVGDIFRISKIQYDKDDLISYSIGDNSFDTMYINSNNPLIDNKNDLIPISSILDFEIYSLNFKKMLGNPLIDPWDFIKFKISEATNVYAIKSGLYKSGLKKCISTSQINDGYAITLGQNDLTYNGKITCIYTTTITQQAKSKNQSYNSSSYKQQNSYDYLLGLINNLTERVEELEQQNTSNLFGNFLVNNNNNNDDNIDIEENNDNENIEEPIEIGDDNNADNNIY